MTESQEFLIYQQLTELFGKAKGTISEHYNLDTILALGFRVRSRK